MFKLRLLAGLAGLVAAASLVVAPMASANGGNRGTVSGARCVVNGVIWLADNGLLVAAAKQQVDYDTIDSDSGGTEGLINADLPTPSFLPLDTVIALHYTNPALFDWCLR